MNYTPPTAGTFYVPPQHADRVAAIPPLTGDFAAGSRTLLTPLSVVLVLNHSPNGKLHWP